jgi:hypothetical protein
MVRTFMFGAACAAVFTVLPTAFAQGQFGTADEAKAMLVKAAAAVKSDKTKTLDLINKGEGGFLDRDLYPFCFELSDGKILAVASNNAKQFLGTDIRALKDGTGRYMARTSTPRHRNRKVKLVRSATCFRGRAPTRHRFRR